MEAAGKDLPTIEIEPGSREGVRILRVSGALTLNNFFAFQEATRAETVPITLIDLKGVPYMDSAALGCIISVHVACERTKRKYALVGVPARLRSLFSMAGVDGMLICYPDAAEAEAALA